MPGRDRNRIELAGGRRLRALPGARFLPVRIGLGCLLGLVSMLASMAAVQAQTASPSTQTSAQLDMAQAIDVMCSRLAMIQPSLSPQSTDLLRVCTNLVFNDDGGLGQPGYGLDQQSLNGAVQALNGEELQGPQQRIQDIRDTQTGIISARLSAIRAGRAGGGLSVAGLDAGTPDRAYALDMPQEYAVLPAQFAEDGFLSRLGLFVTGSGSFGNKNSTGTAPGFDFHSEGLTVGADYRINDSLVAGASLGYMRFDSDFDTTANSPSGQGLDSNGVQLSVFGSFYPTDKFFIDGIANVGWSFYDSSRHIVVPSNSAAAGVDEKVSGDFDALNYGFATNAGYQLELFGANLTPTVRAEYLRSEIHGFTEDGSTSTKLRFGGQDAESLTTNAGLEADYPISTPFGVVSPNARAEYVHEFLGNDNGVKVRYAFDPTQLSEFRVTTADPDRDYGIVGAGVAATFPDGWGAFFDWSTVVGLRDFSVHSLNLGFRKEF